MFWRQPDGKGETRGISASERRVGGQLGVTQRGIAHSRVGLPRCGARPARWVLENPASVKDMVDHAFAALPETGGQWTLEGHSGDGIVATMVAERLVAAPPNSVLGQVYLVGMMLPSGMEFPDDCTIAG